MQWRAANFARDTAAKARRWPANWRGLAALPLAAALLSFGGCATSKNQTAAEPAVLRVWPEPPAEARLAYVRSIRRPADLGVRTSGAGRLAKWLLGRDSRRDTLEQPFGLALDEADNLCLTDTAAGTVSFCDLTRRTWQTWDRIGKIQLALPVAVAKRGNLCFVADSALQKVLAFNLQGKLLFELAPSMQRPAGLAIIGDKLFVADAAAHQILIFDLAGNPAGAFGGRGTGPGQFNYPTHLCSDRKNRLYVTDSLNFRVQVFDAEGKHLNTIGAIGDTPGHLSRPKGVAVDGDGHIYVVDAAFENFQVFDAQGRLLLVVGRNGCGPGEFWLPAGIAITQDNKIYVADVYNQRLQSFQYLPSP